LPFWKSAGYIIAMSVAPRDLEICGPARPCRRPRPQFILSKDGRYSVAKLDREARPQGQYVGLGVKPEKVTVRSRDAPGLQNRCDVVCPDLSKVL
jgi:hypothetical protein